MRLVSDVFSSCSRCLVLLWAVLEAALRKREQLLAVQELGVQGEAWRCSLRQSRDGWKIHDWSDVASKLALKQLLGRKVSIWIEAGPSWNGRSFAKAWRNEDTLLYTNRWAGVSQEGLRFVLKCLSCEMENFWRILSLGGMVPSLLDDWKQPRGLIGRVWSQLWWSAHEKLMGVWMKSSKVVRSRQDAL